MRTFLLAFASVTLIAIVYADWAGCPEGTKFDGYLKDSQQLNSLTEGCHNGRVRSNALPEQAPKTNGTSQNA